MLKSKFVFFIYLFTILTTNETIVCQNTSTPLKYSGEGFYYAKTEADDNFNWYACIYFTREEKENGTKKLLWYLIKYSKNDSVEEYMHTLIADAALKNLFSENSQGSYMYINDNGVDKIRIDLDRKIKGGLFSDDQYVARTFIVEVKDNSNTLQGNYLGKYWDHSLKSREFNERENLIGFENKGSINFVFHED